MDEQIDRIRKFDALRRRLTEAETALAGDGDGESDGCGGDGVEPFCRRLLEQMREGSIELGEDGVILHCNRQFREMIGRPAAQLIGDHILDHVAPEQAAQFEAFFAASEGASRKFEFRRADGSSLSTSVTFGAPSGGERRSRLAIVADLTQAEWTERSFAATEELREREKWSRLAAAAGGVGTFDADLVGGRNRLSVVMHEILGLPLDRALDLAEASRMVFADDRPEFEEKLRIAFASVANGEWSHEMRIRRLSDGAVRWVAFAGQIKFRRDRTGEVAIRAIGAAIDVTDRREIEETLRRSNERLRLALAAGDIGSWELDLRAETAHGDAKCHDIYGFPPDVEPMLGLLLSLVHPDDLILVERAARAAVDPDGDGHYQAEYRIRRMVDGAERWVAARAQAVFENHRAVRLIGVASDITDKKSAERELREKVRLAEQWEGVAASVPGLIASFRLGPDGKTSLPYTSPHVEDIYGLSAEALREDAEIKFARVHPQDVERVRASIAQSARDMSLWRESYRYDHPRKGWIWIEAQSKPRREPDGAVLWHGYLHDVTERKRIEQALADKEARLYATVEGAHDGIVTMDENGAIQSLNTAAARLFGYSKAEAIGADIGTLLPSCACDGRKSSFVDCLRGGGALLRGLCEAEARRKDGALLPVDLTVTEASCHGRRLFIAFVRDLTERRRIEARVQKLHAERLDAVGELAAGLAHELNQPLSATAIYLKAARRLLQMPADQRPANVEDALDNAATQIVRAGQIIGHLREFIARGEPDKTIQSLNDIVNEAAELVMVEVKRSDMRVVLRPSAGDDRILADRVQIKQVVVNLMRNAREAMSGSRQRKMSISTTPVGRSMIRVDVADTGSGLSEAARASLFEPFATTKANGLGVGLTIARSIVEAHYGKIWASSNRDGGATFSFTLPLAAMEHE